MGFWGSALFSNDTTLEVRDAYKGFLSDQMSNEEAYIMTLEQCKELIESDEEPLFWFALAETQWRVGRLTPDVRDKAMEWIDRKGALELWEKNPKGAAGWEKTLQKLKEKLEFPVPKEKKFPKLDQNPWALHDVYAYHLHGEEAEKRGMAGKYMLIQKIGDKDHSHGKRMTTHMQLHSIDHVFDELPSLEDINKYRILPIEDNLSPSFKSPQRPLSMNGYIYIDRSSEYPAKHLTFLGNMPGPSNKYFAYKYFGWLNLDRKLSHNYEFWQDKEYYEIEEGVYNCIIDYDGHISKSKRLDVERQKLDEKIRKDREEYRKAWDSLILRFVYGDKDIRVALSVEESRALKKIFFNEKTPRANKPSCKITENVSIRMEHESETLIFCVACDMSPIINIQNSYLKISEDEQKCIYQIFEKYGGFFPCV